MATFATNTDIHLQLCHDCAHLVAYGTTLGELGADLTDEQADAIIGRFSNLHVYGVGNDDYRFSVCDGCDETALINDIPADYR